jgi:hypothetical protein
MENKRNQAFSIYSESDASYTRLQELSDQMGEINNSLAGDLLNAATENRYSWLSADTFTTLADAVGGRYAAAHDLLNSYDRVLGKMRSTIAAYGQLRSWVEF